MVDFVTNKVTAQIDRIVPNRWNPNSMDAKMFQKAKDSVDKLGFMGSILVRKINHTSADYEIMDGEHRWKVLKEAGATECPVEVINREVSDNEAKLLTVLINNLHGKDDIFKRAEIFKALDDGQQQLLPFTAEEIENEKKFIEFDFGQYEGESDIPERKFSQVIVLQMNTDEASVWNKAKEELQSRGKISLDKTTKKKADLQMVLFLIKNYLFITNNNDFDSTGGKMSVDKSVVK